MCGRLPRERVSSWVVPTTQAACILAEFAWGMCGGESLDLVGAVVQLSQPCLDFRLNSKPSQLQE